MEQTVSQLLFIAGEYTTCCYLGLLLLAIVSERRLTSVSVTMAVVALSACVASLAVTPLYKWASDEHVLSKFSWYGSWMVLNLLAPLLSNIPGRILQVSELYGKNELCLMLTGAALGFTRLMFVSLLS